MTRGLDDILGLRPLHGSRARGESRALTGQQRPSSRNSLCTPCRAQLRTPSRYRASDAEHLSPCELRLHSQHGSRSQHQGPCPSRRPAAQLVLPCRLPSLPQACGLLEGSPALLSAGTSATCWPGPHSPGLRRRHPPSGFGSGRRKWGQQRKRLITLGPRRLPGAVLRSLREEEGSYAHKLASARGRPQHDSPALPGTHGPRPGGGRKTLPSGPVGTVRTWPARGQFCSVSTGPSRSQSRFGERTGS